MAAPRTGVRVVVIGDRGTGKSSLISTVASENFPENVPPVLPPTRLPADYYPDRVPLTIVDTSSALEYRSKLLEEVRRADVIVLTYACDQPLSLNRLEEYWLHQIRELQTRVPIIVVGCKLDLREEHEPVSLEQKMSPIMQMYREIETCIECSAASQLQVPDVFYYAQNAVLHPTAPLFDQETQSLNSRCTRALKRIFTLCDRDEDGALSDAELNDFQVKCFSAPLLPAEIIGVKRIVQEQVPAGVNDRGLTLQGFLYLHALFIEKGRVETTWAVLRKFGYDDEIKLRDDLIRIPQRRAPDQTLELTTDGIEFLKAAFRQLDSDLDGVVSEEELRELFSTAPESPWDVFPYRNAAEMTNVEGLSLNGFLSLWVLMTHLDPARSLANLIYLGLGDQSAAPFRVTRRRITDHKKKQTDRNVFHCLVFGPKNAGKSSLLDSFVGRRFLGNHTSAVGEKYAVNVVEKLMGPNKTLILHEIPEDKVNNFLSHRESLAVADVAVFVYNSFDELSWKKATELLTEVARHGEESGFGVPSLLIAAKDDLVPYSMAVQDSARVCKSMGIDAPVPISVKNGVLNNIFSRIVTAAEHPHLNVPETEVGRSRKEYRRFVNHSLMFVSVGAAVAFIGLTAYRTYAARKNSSS